MQIARLPDCLLTNDLKGKGMGSSFKTLLAEAETFLIIYIYHVYLCIILKLLYLHLIRIRICLCYNVTDVKIDTFIIGKYC